MGQLLHMDTSYTKVQKPKDPITKTQREQIVTIPVQLINKRKRC